MTTEQVVTICISVLTGLGGGAAIIIRLSSWLGRVWANRILEKDRLKYNRELEIVKNELGRASQEYLIKFSTLHAERGQMIRELYKKLMSTQRMMNSTLKKFQQAGELSIEDKITKFVDEFSGFYQFYLDCRIYFPARICSQIEDLAIKLQEAHIDITTYPVDTKDIEYKMGEGLSKERQESWEQARKTFNTQAEPLFRNIETEFRELLGVEKSPNN
ncbi:MAG: hypothetical protein Q8M71_00740 [Thermodesulfovibrionales bacterium]|nr:hypothetical protein [Thermodesulfovibrionales bacterium]